MIDDLTRKKMGMARYVLYKNRMWEENYPMEALIPAGGGILAAWTLFLVISAIRKKRLRSLPVIESIVLSIGVLGYGALSSPEASRPYYFLCGIFGMAEVIQMIKVQLMLKDR